MVISRMKVLILGLAFTLLVTLVSNYEIAKCVSDSCYGDQCRKLDCVNGVCSDEGICECHPCWSGRSCDRYQNPFYPAFANHSMQADMRSNAVVGSLIYTLAAVDKDVKTTCNNNNDSSSVIRSCDCGVVLYDIVSGNEDAMFSVEALTGKVTLNRDITDIAEGTNFQLKVSAVNKEVEGSGGSVRGPMDYAVLQITKGHWQWDQEEDSDEALSRYRRNVPDTVGNLTMSFIKIGPNSLTSVMYVGTAVRFQLQIQFQPSSSNNVSVELFTAQNVSTIMILCKPEVTYVGSNLVYDTAGAEPVLDANDGSKNYDRAVINLGVVSNSGASVGMASVIQIEFEAVLIDSPEIINGSYYWVSGGAEYNDQNEIWIGQISFQAILDDYTLSSQNPTFNITGPTQIPQGASASFSVDMYLPYPAINLNFDVFSPFNFTDALSVCSILVTSVGKNYECFDFLDLPLTLTPSDSTITNERGTLAMGSVVNKGSRVANANWLDNRISVDFVVTVVKDFSLEGQQLWIGATLEIGLNEIWAIQQPFTVIAFVPPISLTVPPVVAFYGDGNNNTVDMGFPKLFHLNISIVPNTLASYTMEASTDGTKFSICKSFLKTIGKNIPCVVPEEVAVTSTASGLAFNRIDWNLGDMQQMTLMDPMMYPYADMVEVSVFVSLLNYAGITSGDTDTLTGKVVGFDSQEVTFSSPLTVASLTANATATNYSIPTFTWDYEMGSTSAYPNQTIDLRLVVSLYPGALNFPFIVTFFSSNSTTNDLNLVRSEVMSVGQNLPCTSQSIANASASYSFIDQPDDNVGITLDLGGVVNVAEPPTGVFVPTKDDQLNIRVVLFVKEFSTAAALEASVTYASYETPWQDTQSFTIAPVGVQQYSNQTEANVYFDFSNNELANVQAGFEYKRQILIKPPPKSVATWQIMADATLDADISVCSLAVLDYGYDIPFIDKAIPTSVYKQNGRNEKGWIGLYPLTNIADKARLDNSSFDQSSILIEVTMKVSQNAALATKTVNISVDHGLDGVDNSTDAQFVVVAAAGLVYDAAASVPSENFTLSAVNENSTAITSNVYLGQTLIVRMALEYPLESISHGLQVELFGPSDGSINIAQYDLVFVGQNFPCLMKDLVPLIVKSGANIYNDKAGLDFVLVSQTPRNATSPENIIIVEAVVTILRDSAVAVGSVITLTSTIAINGTALTPLTMPLTIIAAPPIDRDFNYKDGGAYVTLDASNVTFSLGSNEFATINASITILPNTSDAIILTVGPTITGTNGLVMTVEEFTVVKFGRNLGVAESPFSIAPVFTPTDHSQKSQAVITIDRITNTGHSHRAWKYEEGDDDIVVEAVIRMSDDVIIAAGTSYNCPFSATYLDLTATDDAVIVSDKQASDDIILEIEPFVDATTLHNEGDTIPVSFWIRHSNLSKTEAVPLRFAIYLTPYLQLNSASLAYEYIRPTPPTLTQAPTSTSFMIEFPTFFFTDNVTFSFTMDFLPNILKSNNAQESVKVVYEANYDLPSKTLTQINDAMHLLNITMAAQPILLCPVEVALGMGSGSITDCQLSGSPGLNAYFLSRPGAAGWSPGVRMGNYQRYLQIHLGNVVRLTKVTLTQTSADKLNSFRIDFSNDGILWQTGQVVSAPNTAAATTLAIPKPIDATYVRFVVVSTFTPNTIPTFTLELHGCVIYVVTGAVLCDVRNGAQPKTPYLGFKKRMMAKDLVKGYFCDMLPNLADVKCFSSADGYTWQAIDKSVINILGYQVSKNRLYGLDKNMQAIVMSSDNGNTWKSISNTTYLAALANTADYLPASDVPWNNQLNTSPVTNGAFAGKFDGLYYNSVKVANWMDCCN